ncbi:unnamed protein product [Clonostachys rhizophaga]|uniref:Uncharacterized protein n=1 Tax=Clonostachys rhizophaga TaxID=160324 RepID=A0A9N9V406_9HYPO|nr:unnamed protein product [Clonostachys rhizophaga]
MTTASSAAASSGLEISRGSGLKLQLVDVTLINIAEEEAEGPLSNFTNALSDTLGGDLALLQVTPIKLVYIPGAMSMTSTAASVEGLRLADLEVEVALFNIPQFMTTAAHPATESRAAISMGENRLANLELLLISLWVAVVLGLGHSLVWGESYLHVPGDFR